MDDIVLAAAMAKKLGVDDSDIIRAIKNLKPVPHRLELIKNGRISIIDDTYNFHIDIRAVHNFLNNRISGSGIKRRIPHFVAGKSRIIRLI